MLNLKRTLWILISLAAVLLAGCAAPATSTPAIPATVVPAKATAEPAPTAAPTLTAMPVEPLGASTPTPEHMHMDTTPAAAMSGMDAMSMPSTGSTSLFDVRVAQYFMDAAGFHGMAEALSDTQKIDPAYVGTVTRVTKVLSQTAWPEALNDQAQEFIGALNTFATALSNDDTQAAIEASDVVHDAQHELSHAVDHALEGTEVAMGEADPFQVSVAQYFMDAAGFHGMAATLSDTQKIDATYLGKVTRVTKVLAQTTWPEALNDQAQEFIGALSTFATALGNDDTKAAIAASDVVHDAQHELSHAIDHWLADAAQSTAVSAFNIRVAQYFMDAAGFHGMAATLSDTQKIDPAYVGTVTRVTKVLAHTAWPAELNNQAQGFIGVLNTFATALGNDDTKAAIEASDVVHDAQHELSHTIDHWWAEMAARGPQIAIEQAWAMPAMASMGADNGAFYVTIKNGGVVADRLIGAKADACGMLELDDMVMANGQMEMKLIDSIAIPAGGTVELKPGSLHIMCMAKKTDFTVGAKVPVTLVFERAGEIAATADIREP